MAKAMVEIKAAISEYQSAMKTAAAEMKKLSSEYNLAATHAKLYGSESDRLRAKVTELTGKIDIQKKSVEQNRQQHQNLTEKLEAQQKKQESLKNKVEAARQAYEQSKKSIDENAEETEKLKNEYEKLEVQLQRNQTSMKNTENAIIKQKAAVNDSQAALNNLTQELKEVNAELARAPFDAYASKAGKIGASLTSVGKKLMPLSAGIAGLGVAAVKTAADFDSEMSKVASISGATGEDFDKLRSKASEMGLRTKFSATEAGQAMEYMAMAGWKTGDMLDGIEGIMNLAAASGEDLATTSDIVTNALTAFGLSASDSGHFSDILAKAAANANVDVAMMGETFQYAAPVLGAMGYSAEDAAVAIGLMGSAGIQSSQAGTALRAALTNLAKPSKQVAAAMDAYGISLTDSTGRMYTLQEIMEQLRHNMGGLSEAEQTQAAATLFGKEAMSGMLAIINSSDEDFGKLTAAIAECDGTSASMAETMQDNLQGQITMLKSQLQVLAIGFGDLLVPALRNGVKHLQNWVDWLNNMDESQKQTIIRVAMAIAAIGPLLVGLGKVISFTATVSRGIGTLAAGLSKIGGVAGIATSAHTALAGAIGFLASPIGIVVAALAVLTAATVHLWNTNEEFRNTITSIWENIKTTFQEFTQGIVDRLNSLGFSFSSFSEVVSTIWNEFCNLLEPVITGVFNNISIYIKMTLDMMLGALDFFINLFQGNWSGCWDAIQSIFEAVWTGMSGWFKNILTTIRGVTDVFLGWFGTSWSELWGGVQTFFTDTWNNIAAFFTNTWTAIATSITEFANSVKNTVTTIFREVYSVVSSALKAIQSIVTSTMNSVRTTITNVWTSIRSVVTNATGAIRSTVITVFTAVKSTVSSVWNDIRSTTANTWNAVKSAALTPIRAVQSSMTSTLNGIKSSVTYAWENVRSTTSSTWNAIKSAIMKPINDAKNAVGNAIDAIRSKFNFSWSLPHLKLPHPSISGKFSLNPPSVPKFNISWYKNGGIMTQPTLFGASGNTLLAGGEAGAEAILPLAEFYTRLSDLLDKKLDTVDKGTTVYVYVDMDGEEVATHVYTKVEEKITDEMKRRR